MVYFVYKKSNNQGIIASNLTLFGIPGIKVNTVANFQSSDVSGIAITGSATYNVYAFKTTGVSYTVNYSTTVPTLIYVLAVGGGGGGGSFGSGGAGGGGVAMVPVSIPPGNSTITVSVGVGGTGAGTNAGTGGNGGDTTVSFTAVPTANITAGGGCGGCSRTTPTYTQYGSGGGGGGSAGNCAPSLANNYGGIFANNGAVTVGNASGGGGGAGTMGYCSTATGGAGGDGIRCYLPGIKDFSPSGTAYGTYYWGGGGGGSSASGRGGNGGLGGGGGGGFEGAGPAGTPGTGGISVGSTPGTGSDTAPGTGGTNTGGGGGGNWISAPGANGGSGIVVIAFPTSSITTNTGSVLTNPAFSSAAYQSLCGAYACRLINYNYWGPIFTLRHSADTTGASAANFMSDTNGNLYTGTGVYLQTWLTSAGANTTYAYVVKWYDQGRGAAFNTLYQNSTGSQPTYNVAGKYVDFGYTGAPQTNCYFNMPVISSLTGNPGFTVTVKLNNVVQQNSYWFEMGTQGGSGCITISYGGGIRCYFYGPDFNTSNPMTGQSTYTFTRTVPANTANFYYNTVLKNSQAATANLAVTSTAGYIGCNSGGGPGGFAGQIYCLYVANIPFSDSDRGIIES